MGSQETAIAVAAEGYLRWDDGDVTMYPAGSRWAADPYVDDFTLMALYTALRRAYGKVEAAAKERGLL